MLWITKFSEKLEATIIMTQIMAYYQHGGNLVGDGEGACPPHFFTLGGRTLLFPPLFDPKLNFL